MSFQPSSRHRKEWFPRTKPAITLHAKSVAAMPLLLSPGLDTLGEAYVEGKIDIDGSLADIIDVGNALARTCPTASGKWRRVEHYFTHSKAADKRAIQYHYDVSDDFYKLWLDRRMVYSCAYFENGDEDLATAQQKKIDHILTKIQLRPGQTLLDTGCGWGALVIRAARKFGARCIGITLSENQFDWATELVKAMGLTDRAEIRLQDYREVTGCFNRVTSVGMFEHVGCSNLPQYFTVCKAFLLKRYRYEPRHHFN
ncbi:cyclopropane-fatty-acyl-phospholipid synthase [Caballeronia arvi]|uniref:Cyclopropane-fatty-acyl-phospholipid synthase n=1 Tax=Caballeronia arvi TaxID=1777135 RepID=A0A158L413_9BURK|nr:cyclopropane-fatty-acyl-phospholipid synthase [Caballeronia arvi]